MTFLTTRESSKVRNILFKSLVSVLVSSVTSCILLAKPSPAQSDTYRNISVSSQFNSTSDLAESITRGTRVRHNTGGRPLEIIRLGRWIPLTNYENSYVTYSRMSFLYEGGSTNRTISMLRNTTSNQPERLAFDVDCTLERVSLSYITIFSAIGETQSEQSVDEEDWFTMPSEFGRALIAGACNI